MADFLQGWLAGGASRGSREAQLYANDSAMQRAFAERQAQQQQADARIAQAKGLTAAASAGDPNAQMELAAMGLGETPQQIAQRQAQTQESTRRFEADFGLRKEGQVARGEERDAAQGRFDQDLGFRKEQAGAGAAEREGERGIRERWRIEDKEQAAIERAQDIARSENRAMTNDDMQRARLEMERERLDFAKGAEDRARAREIEDAERFGNQYAGVPKTPASQGPVSDSDAVLELDRVTEEQSLQDYRSKARSMLDEKGIATPGEAPPPSEFERGQEANKADYAAQQKPGLDKIIGPSPAPKSGTEGFNRMQLAESAVFGGLSSLIGDAYGAFYDFNVKAPGAAYDWLTGVPEAPQAPASPEPPSEREVAEGNEVRERKKAEMAASDLAAKQDLARRATELKLQGRTPAQIDKLLAEPPDTLAIVRYGLAFNKVKGTPAEETFVNQMVVKAETDPAARAFLERMMGVR